MAIIVCSKELGCYNQYMSILDITPFIPSDAALAKSELPDKAMRLSTLSAKLSGQLSTITAETLERHMRVANSYYSNLIEGNATRPYEIRAAQRGEYSSDPAKRDLQQESLAHMDVQRWLSEQSLDLDTLFSSEFIQNIHRVFYENVPERLWELKNSQGNVIDVVVPGQYRQALVEVGRHIPPDAEKLSDLMTGFCETFHPDRFQGDRKLIAIMAAHHRFAWIHPFSDGNGRVGRLFTDAALKLTGLDSTGAWCLSRGLARQSSIYKSKLAAADAPRKGDFDGRGQLSESALMNFCEFMLDCAIDQVSYISELLDLASLRKRINGYVQARNDGRVKGLGELKSIASILLHTAFVQGELERSQAIEMSGMSERTARRMLRQLKGEGLLSETSTRSPLRWEIPEHAEPWYFPELVPA